MNQGKTTQERDRKKKERGTSAKRLVIMDVDTFKGSMLPLL
jgi:hypothetical protein